MTRLLRQWLTPLLALSIVSLDQFTKSLVLNNLLVGESWMPVDAIYDWLRITHVRNTGAAFGMFPWASIVFMLIAVAVITAIVIYAVRHWHDAPFWVRLSLGLMLGGSSGNLIDRIRFGSVVDFVDFGYRANWWPVFNVADSCIFFGVSLLAIYLSFQPQARQHTSTADTSAATQRSE